ncbi:HK97 gp10 family phage protein [Shouchella clausii]|jgi:HK97 gp10 family phage protein|uniref:HK97-gp10 family putative phage morphogenesis protein n=1 Tax=Shouchella TaxID=2893057 RepID=UPI0004E744AC|nr:MULTISPECIES: HK97-gp10 family putative phage morphogenesis protein [Shouchella]MCM3311979.1 HK97 gp10 family phage protein [Psychrobacillus sp. MER TA 17]ALA55060.1 Phage capsid and scaffold [Shouchella clausii]MDP0466085.1 HK97 gp10 family phage protein [Shouchella rhizosphaerae]MDP5259300.1 HK97 gp10 family phage protein [Shouchella clausii]MDP5267251.1 HK97 gp10 family phage protein [Shouchella clausii]
MGLKYGQMKLAAFFSRKKREILREINQAIEDTAQYIQAQAMLLAPVDKGNLKNSIQIYYLRGGTAAVVQVEADYGIYVEYGTGIYAVKGNGRSTPWTFYKGGKFYATRGQRAQPYWNPALDLGHAYFKRRVAAIRI